MSDYGLAYPKINLSSIIEVMYIISRESSIEAYFIYLGINPYSKFILNKNNGFRDIYSTTATTS